MLSFSIDNQITVGNRCHAGAVSAQEDVVEITNFVHETLRSSPTFSGRKLIPRRKPLDERYSHRVNHHVSVLQKNTAIKPTFTR